MSAKTSPSRRKKADLCGCDEEYGLDACDRKKGLLSGKYSLLVDASKQV